MSKRKSIVDGAMGVPSNTRKTLVEEHFSLDENGGLLGALKQDANYSRDVHDWFNIVALIPLCVLNAMNWEFGKIGSVAPWDWEILWKGKFFYTFYIITVAYFIIDALWVVVVPNCVRSPGVILQHHFASLAYLTIPGMYPEYGWLLGVCMSVEVNTWLIIARRLFNKTGQGWNVGGFEIKIISILFYITWISIRLIIYPGLFVVACQAYFERSARVGSYINALTPAPFLQSVFCMLNFKWSYDLFMSKLRQKEKGPSKGL